jgi:hypothetical protein
MQEPKGVFDYTVAYEIARKAIVEKPVKKERHETEPKKYWLP